MAGEYSNEYNNNNDLLQEMRVTTLPLGTWDKSLLRPAPFSARFSATL